MEGNDWWESSGWQVTHVCEVGPDAEKKKQAHLKQLLCPVKKEYLSSDRKDFYEFS